MTTNRENHLRNWVKDEVEKEKRKIDNGKEIKRKGVGTNKFKKDNSNANSNSYKNKCRTYNKEKICQTYDGRD